LNNQGLYKLYAEDAALMVAASSAFMNIGTFAAFGFSGLYNIYAFKHSLKFVAAAFGTFNQFLGPFAHLCHYIELVSAF